MSAVTMVDARALPIEVGWRVGEAIIEEHYEPDFAVMVRLHDADRSTSHDVAARA